MMAADEEAVKRASEPVWGAFLDDLRAAEGAMCSSWTADHDLAGLAVAVCDAAAALSTAALGLPLNAAWEEAAVSRAALADNKANDNCHSPPIAIPTLQALRTSLLVNAVAVEFTAMDCLGALLNALPSWPAVNAPAPRSGSSRSVLQRASSTPSLAGSTPHAASEAATSAACMTMLHRYATAPSAARPQSPSSRNTTSSSSGGSASGASRAHEEASAAVDAARRVLVLRCMRQCCRVFPTPWTRYMSQRGHWALAHATACTIQAATQLACMALAASREAPAAEAAAAPPHIALAPSFLGKDATLRDIVTRVYCTATLTVPLRKPQAIDNSSSSGSVSRDSEGAPCYILLAECHDTYKLQTPHMPDDAVGQPIDYIKCFTGRRQWRHQMVGVTDAATPSADNPASNSTSAADDGGGDAGVGSGDGAGDSAAASPRARQPPPRCDLWGALSWHQSPVDGVLLAMAASLVALVPHSGATSGHAQAETARYVACAPHPCTPALPPPS